MKQQDQFFKTVCGIAIPVTFQSMLQSSFSVIDQIMIGQLGSTGVAAVGLAGKFSSVFSVVVSAVGAVAGIMISQYMGQQNQREEKRSFSVNLWISACIAMLFMLLCLLMPGQIMGLYTKDQETCDLAAGYLRIIGLTFLPIAGTTMFATLFRCMEKASLPLYAGMIAALMNTILNYILIFGKLGIEPLGVYGAAIATVISQFASFMIMYLLYRVYCKREKDSSEFEKSRFQWKQYGIMLFPILICEFMWSLGENIYAGIYGHLGTMSCAAMTLINPIQSLMIGALCGLSQAAGVIIGKLLGKKEMEEAYNGSKKLMLYGWCGSLVLSVLILITRSFYVNIYQVELNVKMLTSQILIAYAVIAPFKVQNMILGGGILRSGGKTDYVMWIDLMGTWIFGVPLGMLAAFVWKLQIPYVYFILSLEECMRYLVSLIVFKRKGWMQQLKAVKDTKSA
ncbi:MAG: MATE family efflux transporter [Lachnospiraceae bacterium]|nr:MATE family efflux transporter [Lachnospiraceae bacterium]